MQNLFIFYDKLKEKLITVKTEVKPSSIGGLGLFASEFIPKGTLVWKNHTDSELIMSREQFELLSDYMKGVCRIHAYVDKKTNQWKLPLDNSKFFNHSYNPNTFQDEDGNSVALTDINLNEEITVNYTDYDGGEGDFTF